MRHPGKVHIKDTRTNSHNLIVLGCQPIIGTPEVAEGQWGQCFVCEDYALHDAEEITPLGG